MMTGKEITSLFYEALSFNTHPCLEEEMYDGWLLRYAEGYTKRANSVNVVGASIISIAEKIQKCEEKYAERHLPIVFKITPMASELDDVLGQMGYFAVDKYTGLPTSGGYYYEGQHTIDGYEYSLTLQSDMSIVAPALGAYKAITDEMPKEAAPETKPTPLFYHVTGDNGQEMWLFGTIHIGDERTAYLPQEIYDAFDASDALALEFDSEAFEKRMEEDEDFQDKISGYYFFSDNTLTKQHMDPELYETALKLLKATGSYNINTDYMKAYFWSSFIDDFYLRQGYQLTRAQGIEERLTTRANKQNKKILDVESGEFQVSMLSGFSDALQETLLAECVFTDPMTSWKSAKKLLDMWCAGDEAAMRKYLSTDPETLAQMSDEERALYEEYNNAMTLDRNRAMLEVAKSYLESGETVFFAVGLAHLLVDEGLVDTLRDAGYTVELVTYSE